jgi:hypothetical protein
MKQWQLKRKIAVVVMPDILVFLPMKLIAWQRRGDAYLSASFISREEQFGQTAALKNAGEFHFAQEGGVSSGANPTHKVLLN